MLDEEKIKLSIIENINDSKYVALLILKNIYEGKILEKNKENYLKYVFRTVHYVPFFEYLITYSLVTRGRKLAPSLIGNSPQLQGLYPLFSAWIEQCFTENDSAFPPVNEISGMAFVSMILDGAEMHLLGIRALEEAKRVSVLRGMIEAAFQTSSETWVLASSFLSHIGHMVYAATLVELQRHGRIIDKRIGILPGPSHNNYLRRLFDRYVLESIPADARYGEIISARKRYVTDDGSFRTMSELVSEAARLWAKDKPFIAIDSETKTVGDEALRILGVPPEAPVITLHVRGPGYNSSIAETMSLRDAQIETYRRAVEYLAGTGAYVIRLGDQTMTRMGPADRFIDYPFTKAKSDWMDIYLASRCRFHIGTSSGMSFVPLLFGRPVLFTNWITLAHMVCSPNVVTLPKRLIGPDGEIVPMHEYCGRHGHILVRYDAMLHGLAFQDNTPEEILDAVQLMDSHIDPVTGGVDFPEEMFDEQQAMFEASPLNNRPQIPPAFWRQYRVEEAAD